MKGVLEEIFVRAEKLLKEQGYSKREHGCVDGTKNELASGGYRFVWKEGIEQNDGKPDAKVRAYSQLADAVWEDEHEEEGNRDREEGGNKEGYPSKAVKALTERMEKLEAAGEGENKKNLQRALKTVKKDWLRRKGRYETAKGLWGKRNRATKTDRDAPFMSMKEDPRGNGQLKPGSTVEIGTEHGFVRGYDFVPHRADSRTLKPHLRRQKRRLGEQPPVILTDAG